MTQKKPKAFMFAFTHALPTAMLMHEDGRVIAAHGGSDAGDAKSWLRHYLPKKLEDFNEEEDANLTMDNFEIVELDQELVEKHLYQDEDISILGEEFKKAFDNNQRRKREYENENLSNEL